MAILSKHQRKAAAEKLGRSNDQRQQIEAKAQEQTNLEEWKKIARQIVAYVFTTKGKNYSIRYLKMLMGFVDIGFFAWLFPSEFLQKSENFLQSYLEFMPAAHLIGPFARTILSLLLRWELTNGFYFVLRTINIPYLSDVKKAPLSPELANAAQKFLVLNGSEFGEFQVIMNRREIQLFTDVISTEKNWDLVASFFFCLSTFFWCATDVYRSGSFYDYLIGLFGNSLTVWRLNFFFERVYEVLPPRFREYLDLARLFQRLFSRSYINFYSEFSEIFTNATLSEEWVAEVGLHCFLCEWSGDIEIYGAKPARFGKIQLFENIMKWVTEFGNTLTVDGKNFRLFIFYPDPMPKKMLDTFLGQVHSIVPKPIGRIRVEEVKDEEAEDIESDGSEEEVVESLTADEKAAIKGAAAEAKAAEHEQMAAALRAREREIAEQERRRKEMRAQEEAQRKAEIAKNAAKRQRKRENKKNNKKEEAKEEAISAILQIVWENFSEIVEAPPIEVEKELAPAPVAQEKTSVESMFEEAPSSEEPPMRELSPAPVVQTSIKESDESAMEVVFEEQPIVTECSTKPIIGALVDSEELERASAAAEEKAAQEADRKSICQLLTHKAVQDVFSKLGDRARLTGGAPRDALGGKLPRDYDFMYEGSRKNAVKCLESLVGEGYTIWKSKRRKNLITIRKANDTPPIYIDIVCKRNFNSFDVIQREALTKETCATTLLIDQHGNVAEPISGAIVDAKAGLLRPTISWKIALSPPLDGLSKEDKARAEFTYQYYNPSRVMRIIKFAVDSPHPHPIVDSLDKFSDFAREIFVNQKREDCLFQLDELLKSIGDQEKLLTVLQAQGMIEQDTFNSLKAKATCGELTVDDLVAAMGVSAEQEVAVSADDKQTSQREVGQTVVVPHPVVSVPPFFSRVPYYGVPAAVPVMLVPVGYVYAPIPQPPQFVASALPPHHLAQSQFQGPHSP